MKQTDIKNLRQRYLTGLQKLAEAEQMITDLQEELKSLQPRLIQTSSNTEALMINIEQDTVQVEKKKELVAADEAVANKKFADAQAIKDDCEKELAKAVPALSAATEALNTLRQDDVRVVKAMKNPPSGVKMVNNCVFIKIDNRYYSHPDFDPKKIRNTSTACEGLCRWVRAMVVYDQVIKIVAPKKEALEAANQELALQNEKLEMKRKELREVRNYFP
ncbi:hypothetical protein Avbf_01108 [Armadillidium vulgare]|nr:hypothetical protein Avbf_01108 [Armadillidium vulgare]